MSADWNRIKTEYITTDISYRKLAQKYGVGESTLFAKASKEKWVEQREQYQSKTVAKTLDAIARKQVSRAQRLQSVADKLLCKVESLLDKDEELPLDTQGMKHISGVLKDIREIQMIRSDADMREQEARIEKLHRDAERDDKEKPSITITLEGSLSDYAQ